MFTCFHCDSLFSFPCAFVFVFDTSLKVVFDLLDCFPFILYCHNFEIITDFDILYKITICL